MNDHWDRLSRLGSSAKLLVFVLLLLVGSGVRTHAEDYLSLPAVKPVMQCADLANTDLGTVDGRRLIVQSAAFADTPKGRYCKVDGTVDGLTVFAVFLPMEHWTQRLLENSSNLSAIANAGGCAPALNGEMAVAFNNMGMGAPGGEPGSTGQGSVNQGRPPGNQGPPQGLLAGSPASTLQQRIDSANNSPIHGTVQAAKAIVKIFYGQPQRFSYFMGCSMGGGQALNEVQRFPLDFDGVSAGSPLMIPTVHNIFFHPWESYINKRADGSRILASSRLPVLHRAVMEHCVPQAGELDGVLLQPTACKFDPTWVECKPGVADTSQCLTTEEVGVVEKLYEGPGDAEGRHFEIAGFAMGSELRWGLSTADHVANPEANIGPRLKAALAPPESDKSADELQKNFDYTQAWFDKILILAPLFDSTNTNLRPFEQRGGKLILWNGAEDLTIQPEVSVAYYQGVQKVLGEKVTDTFLRLFMIPGYGHCGGGEIPFQFDVLTPLMAWTERGRAPEKILASKPAQEPAGPGPYMGVRTPYAAADQPAAFERPIFPFPYMAAYSGKGYPDSASSYKPVKSAAPIPEKFNTEAIILFGPDNRRSYHVENGQLVPDKN